jgi:hypothetical protein
MAKSFLEAVEEAMPLYGRSPVTGAPKARPASDPSEGDPDDEELLLAKLAEAEQDKAMAAQMGGVVADGADTPAAMGNSSTELGVTGKDLYRVTSGDEDVTEVSMEDLVGQDPDALARMMGTARQPEIDVPAADAIGNSSTEVGKGDSAYRLTSGEEPVASGDMVEAAKPQFDKSALWDPTMGARQAGIPEETLATLFKKTHGGAFNPNSKMDRAKMRQIQDMIQEDKSLLALSPTKFALKVYSRK